MTGLGSGTLGEKAELGEMVDGFEPEASEFWMEGEAAPGYAIAKWNIC